MKKMKSGFTLAEVLITLGIIGVIAAIVMPSVMTNYTYKTVGVKLSKFAAQLEGATRPYVVQNNVFDAPSSIVAFIEESFIIKDKTDDIKDYDCTKTGNERTDAIKGACGSDTTTKALQLNLGLISTTTPTFLGGPGTGAGLSGNGIVTLKDGTRFQAYPIVNHGDQADIDTDQVGNVVWGVAFDPAVSGLPKKVNKAYRYVVTELGYVYPDRVNDTCMGAMYDANFETNSKFFADTDKGCFDGFKKGKTDGESSDS